MGVATPKFGQRKLPPLLDGGQESGIGGGGGMGSAAAAGELGGMGGMGGMLGGIQHQQQSLRRGSPLPLRHIASAPSKVSHSPMAMHGVANSMDIGLLSPPNGSGLGGLGPGMHHPSFDPLRNSTPAVLGAASLAFQQEEHDDEDEEEAHYRQQQL